MHGCLLLLLLALVLLHSKFTLLHRLLGLLSLSLHCLLLLSLLLLLTLLLLLSLFALKSKGGLPFYLSFLGNHDRTLRNSIIGNNRAGRILGKEPNSWTSRGPGLLLHQLWSLLNRLGRHVLIQNCRCCCARWSLRNGTSLSKCRKACTQAWWLWRGDLRHNRMWSWRQELFWLVHCR